MRRNVVCTKDVTDGIVGHVENLHQQFMIKGMRGLRMVRQVQVQYSNDDFKKSPESLGSHGGR